MHLVRTNVARTTEATVTVEFHGEGNELVAIRMSADSVSNDDDAIAFAAQMLEDLRIAATTPGPATTREGASIDEMLAAEEAMKSS